MTPDAPDVAEMVDTVMAVRCIRCGEDLLANVKWEQWCHCGGLRLKDGIATWWCV